MTVCIAATCERGRVLILAADREFGIGTTSAQFKTGKLNNLGANWYIGFSDDVSNASEVVSLAQNIAAEISPPHQSHQIMTAVQDSYRAIRTAKLEALYIAARGRTLNEFKEHGKDRLSDAVFAEIDNRCSFTILQSI